MSTSTTTTTKGVGEFFSQEEKNPEMVAYLKSLGLDPDYKPPKDDDRRIVVERIIVDFEDHEPTIIPTESKEDIEAAAKTIVGIKEGCKYKIALSFRVQHDILNNFIITTNIKKLKKKITEESVRLGSYPPGNKYKTISLPADGYTQAPSFGLGNMNVKVRFGDSDNEELLVIRFQIKLVKDWS